MPSKLSLWERVLRLIMSDKSYVLRTLNREQLAVSSSVSTFKAQVEDVELSIADVIVNLRTLEGRQVDNDYRLDAINIKVEGVGQDFQTLQNKRKHEEAADKAELLSELIDEQVGLEKTIADNNDRIKEQKARVAKLRRGLTEMKELLRNAEDKSNDLNTRYKSVQAMTKAQATLSLLESGSYLDSMNALEGTIRKGEAAVEARTEVREASEERQFAELERSMAVSERLDTITNRQKGIQQA